MGWATTDEQVKNRAEIQIAKVRSEVYTLGKILREIVHTEKKAVLVQLFEETWALLDNIDFQLHR